MIDDHDRWFLKLMKDDDDDDDDDDNDDDNNDNDYSSCWCMIW